MAHIQYTLLRSGTYYYNRRVPKHARHLYGNFIRLALSSDVVEVTSLSGRLNKALDAAWEDPKRVCFVDLEKIVDSAKPKLTKLSEFAEDYLALKAIEPKPVRIAVSSAIQILGDRHVRDYEREDLKAFVHFLVSKGNKTATIRRRVNSVAAILNYAYAELDLEKRNPASRLLIKGEGRDAHRRGTFSEEQLRAGYEEALGSGSSVKLLMPVLGETGCRLGEIVGLRTCDVDLEAGIIRVAPHEHRRLKTTGSERTLPLVGYADEAMHQLMKQAGDGVLFPRYLKGGRIMATHASNSVNVWLKKRFDGLTAHSLRHTMRDRLRAVTTPLEMIDQIGGWSSVSNIGSSYGKGYSVELIREWMNKIKVH
jgi:integrase